MLKIFVGISCVRASIQHCRRHRLLYNGTAQPPPTYASIIFGTTVNGRENIFSALALYQYSQLWDRERDIDSLSKIAQTIHDVNGCRTFYIYLSDDDIFSVIIFVIQEIRHFNVMRFFDNAHHWMVATKKKEELNVVGIVNR